MPQHFADIGMHLQLVKEHFISAQQIQQLDPLHQPHRQVFMQEIQSFDAHREILLFYGSLVDDSQVVGGVVALFLH